ncbi:Uncharacterised protein [Serratia proteamaculans]|nr:Uncharacterised protein [Serratia proteamaculans]CAI2001624.1 Uncharacterised protein [Serratia proteamaculans]
MTFNTYLVPFVLSILVVWSLRYHLIKVNLLKKIALSLIISMIVVFLYQISHDYFNDRSKLDIGFVFDGFYLTCSLVVFFFNMVALWVFTKISKVKD